MTVLVETVKVREPLFRCLLVDTVCHSTVYLPGKTVLQERERNTTDLVLISWPIVVNR
jgi:hypothetical protein